MFSIKNHRLLNNGEAVPYVASKNKGGVIKPLYIVLHDTASPLTPQGDIAWLSGANGNNNSSAHFVVARDGKVTQLVPTNIKAWHAGVSKWNGKANCNDFTVGIEIDNPGKVEKISEGVYGSYYGHITEDANVKFAYKETPQHGKGYWAFYTPEQINAVVGMCQALIKAYGCTEIITHWLIAPGRKVDTNPLFPLAMVREKALGNKDAAPASEPAQSPTPFVADATVLVDNLNLRAQPDMGNNVITSLLKGERVDVRGVHGEWLQVMTRDNKGGYLHTSLVQQDK